MHPDKKRYGLTAKDIDDMRNARWIGLSSVQHFLVDGLCICCMYLLIGVCDDYDAGAYDYQEWMDAVLTYNVLAFMSQPLTGLLADRLPARHWLLILSSLLLTLAVAAVSLVPSLMAVAVLAGLGNSLFHVWGGKQTVVKAGNDLRALGVFVSTGALGLAVGLVYCSWGLLYVLLLSFIVLSILNVRTDRGHESRTCDAGLLPDNGTPPLIPRHWLTPVNVCVVVVLLMLFVGYRSFTGEVFAKGIHKSLTLILTIGAVSMLGKIAGGWIAQRLGILRSMAAVLAGVALCILFRGDSVAVLLVGIFLMNTTMPVTLFLANDVLPGREGLAFGLLAAALIPGYLIAVYW